MPLPNEPAAPQPRAADRRPNTKQLLMDPHRYEQDKGRISSGQPGNTRLGCIDALARSCRHVTAFASHESVQSGCLEIALPVAPQQPLFNRKMSAARCPSNLLQKIALPALASAKSAPINRTRKRRVLTIFTLANP
jgi:hypothetical protein